MAKKDSLEVKNRIIDFFRDREWIGKIEKNFERQIKSAKSSLDKNFEKARKSLNITTKKDINTLQSKIKALEKRIEKIEGANKVKPLKAKTSKVKAEA